MDAHQISIRGARANNLQNISLDIPHNRLIVVTGVSGSGKSSLAFDIIAREGQRRYFETLPTFARLYAGKLIKPEVDSIEGLSPVIAIGQKTTAANARSTAGTMSDLYDLLRLLYARVGDTDQEIRLSRALFSFNTQEGQCQKCTGIGLEEKVDVNKLVTNPEKTLREGALAPTLPTGYIMYSQVTMEVLNDVCQAEGFHVDIPWNDLTLDQQNVILFGSVKIKVPFGKHSLESRLKWTGIKAKPREEGFYKGMIPIMSDILRRDRNENILSYVSSVFCSQCNGDRINQKALSVTVNGNTIAEVARYEIKELSAWIAQGKWSAVAKAIVEKMQTKIMLLDDLGVSHITLDQPATELSASEAQRIRVANQLTAPLSDVLYVLDEPSIGLTSEENANMIAHLKHLVSKGNTVIVVEHDLDTIRNADWIIDIGPKAGMKGGELLFNGTFSNFLKLKTLKDISPTYQALTKDYVDLQGEEKVFLEEIRFAGCTAKNLKNIDVAFKINALNVVNGKSGSGTKALVIETLRKAMELQLKPESFQSVSAQSIENLDRMDQLIFVDQSPIGRTPRSNPATYLGISDSIRDLFASLPESKKRRYTKSRFSFNNKGGRCETCQGAGKIQMGMHFLGKVEILCGTCGGDRFNPETLEIKFNDKSIAAIYELSVEQALDFFMNEDLKALQKIRNGLETLRDIGLGYLKLGQSSITLSGGEAQRIKIANQLQKRDSGNALYIIVEPSIGLHYSDLKSLLAMFFKIVDGGNTVVCIEQDQSIISAANWQIHLGPGGGKNGGQLIYQGVPRSQEKKSESKTLKSSQMKRDSIDFYGVSTNNLKNIDVSFPKNRLSVVIGLSGSGKSSLVYDTLFAEANACFSESLSVYSRSFVQQNSTADFREVEGLNPAIALRRNKAAVSKRSTVGTLSGIQDNLRLLYARLASIDHKEISAQHFSFNHHLGACETCLGIGFVESCSPNKVIENPNKSLINGAVSTNKALDYYGNPNSQFIATLQTIFEINSWNLNQPWKELTEEQQKLVMYGTGDKEWEVEWHFKNKSREGIQNLKSKWSGFCNYINQEFERKKGNKNLQNIDVLLEEITCPTCNGSRLKSHLLETEFLDFNIHSFTQLSIDELISRIEEPRKSLGEMKSAIAKTVLPGVLQILKTLSDLGLGYLSLDRSSRSISGGEYQKVLLSAQLNSHLHGVTYVLDEPTMGLDRNQIKLLVAKLREIISNGNTVIVVEHDPDFIAEVDYVIEMGPESGKRGGEVLFQGTPSKSPMLKSLNSQVFESRSRLKEERIKGDSFGVKGAKLNNLKSIDVTLFEGQITAIVGPSGSGKSTLMRDVLYQSFQAEKSIGCIDVFGYEQFKKDAQEIIFIDQKPLALNALSTPATYMGLLDKIAILFSKLKTSRDAGLKKAHFNYQSKQGRCLACNGYGREKISLDFMSDVWTHCEECDGLRYQRTTALISYQEKSVGEVLELSVREALDFFETEKILHILKALNSIGLGHLKLGQAGNTLSGGESQRIKLVKHLLNGSGKKRLILIDEPSIGLHQNDLLQLKAVFESMVSAGDTIVFVDHSAYLIAFADVRIELGPSSGKQGGYLISK